MQPLPIEPPAEREPLMSRDDLARYLNVPVKTISNWNSYGLGPQFHRVGRHVRYRPEDVDAWLDSRAGIFRQGGAR